MSEPQEYYYVMRTHSGVTANTHTIKVVSRGFIFKDRAEFWMAHEQSLDKSNHKFFIMKAYDLIPYG